MRVLFVNPESGSADALDEVRRAAKLRGIEVRDLRQLDPDDAEVIGVAAVELRAVSNDIAEPDRSLWRLEDGLAALEAALPRLLARLAE